MILEDDEFENACLSDVARGYNGHVHTALVDVDSMLQTAKQWVTRLCVQFHNGVRRNIDDAAGYEIIGHLHGC